MIGLVPEVQPDREQPLTVLERFDKDRHVSRAALDPTLRRRTSAATEASNGRLVRVGLIARRGGGSIDCGFSGRAAHEQ